MTGNHHILNQVMEYLGNAMSECERKGREWWAYLDAYTLLEQAEETMIKEAQAEWQKFKQEEPNATAD